VDTTLVRYQSRLAVCTCCASFAKNLMIMYPQIPRIRYMRVHPVDVSLKKRHVVSVLLNIWWWCVSTCPDSGTIQIHCTHGRGLCPFCFLVRCSVICCQDGCFMALPKVHCQKSISVTILTSNAWRSLSLFGAFPTLLGGHHWSLCATFLVS